MKVLAENGECMHWLLYVLLFAETCLLSCSVSDKGVFLVARFLLLLSDQEQVQLVRKTNKYTYPLPSTTEGEKVLGI